MKSSTLRFAFFTAASFLLINLSSCDVFQIGDSKTQGVTSDEIVIGSHTALSGMVAYWGIGITNAIKLVFEQVNSKGGVHGRKIRFIAEDSHFDIPITIQKANKLIEQDKIFMMLAGMGADQNNAVLEKQLAKNIPNVFPITSALSMIKPHHKLKFTFVSTFYDQTRAVVSFFVKRRNSKSVCVLYQDNEFGNEVLSGVNDQLKSMGMTTTASISHSADSIQFTEEISELKNRNCDVIILGTIVRDTIGAVRIARKMGWKVDIVGASTACNDVVIKLGGEPMEGFFSVNAVEWVDEDMAFGKAKQFLDAYRAKYGMPADQPAQMGYICADIVVQALEKAGRNLTVDSFVESMESIDSYRSPFNGPKRSFEPGRHQATNISELMRIKNGKWRSPINERLFLKLDY
ncbi:ABC transporter substrate-binding protein [bacterium]|nr:ABC transporter substrate-binding protein [bacterium]